MRLTPLLLTLALITAGCASTPPAAPYATPADAPEAAPSAPAAAAVTPAVTPTPKPAAPALPEPTTKPTAVAEVTASSTSTQFPDEKPAAALVDGDRKTRWSSAYADPQTITLRLKQTIAIDRVRIHWENAVATKYALLVSNDGRNWQSQHAFFRNDTPAAARVDDIPLNGVRADRIRLDLLGRVSSDWGFSIYEIEVFPQP